ncbi:hypothetical protein GCM10010469_17200 [Streptomyces labedae]|uniref:Integrase n=1 Tax=Streptomyces labedae TaxID=285569 RepID=A0ABP6QUD7_9ACTN
MVRSQNPSQEPGSVGTWIAGALTLAEHLGHSDPGLTLRVYAHLVPSSQERTRKAVAVIFDTVRSEPYST